MDWCRFCSGFKGWDKSMITKWDQIEVNQTYLRSYMLKPPTPSSMFVRFDVCVVKFLRWSFLKRSKNQRIFMNYLLCEWRCDEYSSSGLVLLEFPGNENRLAPESRGWRMELETRDIHYGTRDISFGNICKKSLPRERQIHFIQQKLWVWRGPEWLQKT